MRQSHCPALPVVVELADEPATDEAAERIRAIVQSQYDFVWRSLRYFGFSETNAEDGAQQVMCILARRIGEIVPGTERSFLFTTAMHVASEGRRAARRRPVAAEEDVDAVAREMPSIEDLLDQRRAHGLLERIVAALPVDLRAVFVLYEIEELTMAEISVMLALPAGTVASRLRRARAAFEALVRRVTAARCAGPGTPRGPGDEP
jgi:RNA polymerase sigma-70 factor (ECF subfamily)